VLPLLSYPAPQSQWAWHPSDWLDLLEPPLLLLAELLERFQQLHHQDLLLQPAARLVDALTALYDRHVGGGDGGGGSGGCPLNRGSRARRAAMTLRSVRAQLAHGQVGAAMLRARAMGVDVDPDFVSALAAVYFHHFIFVELAVTDYGTSIMRRWNRPAWLLPVRATCGPALDLSTS
jgi:hypothetical protein